jgi:drug/metabolite transporter (DMT)-like permease
MIGEILAILSILSFVSSNAFFKRIGNEVSPSQINAIRTGIGALTFIAIGLFAGKFYFIFQFSPMLWLWLLLSIFFGQVVGDTAFFFAQKRMGTTLALAVSMTFPIFTTILSVFILDTTLPYTFYIAMVIILMGISLIGIGKNKLEQNKLDISEIEKELTIEEQVIEQEENAKNDLIKDNRSASVNISTADLTKKLEKEKRTINRYLVISLLIGFLAAISWAVGIILTEYSMNQITLLTGQENYSSILGNIARFPFAVDLLVIMSLKDRGGKKISQWSKSTWGWLIIGSIIGTSLGAYLYTEATRLAGAAFVSLLATTSPIFAIPLSWFINKEKVNLISILGVISTTTGVIIAIVF